MVKSKQSAVESVVLKHGPIEALDIAVLAGCHVSTVRKHLRTMIQKGQIKRQPLWLSQFGYTWLYFRCEDERKLEGK